MKTAPWAAICVSFGLMGCIAAQPNIEAQAPQNESAGLPNKEAPTAQDEAQAPLGEVTGLPNNEALVSRDGVVTPHVEAPASSVAARCTCMNAPSSGEYLPCQQFLKNQVTASEHDSKVTCKSYETAQGPSLVESNKFLPPLRLEPAMLEITH